MAYSFKKSDDSIQDGLRRIAISQLEKGIKELEGGALPQSDKVHQARKRCKKVRGLIRFVREGFKDYSEENAIFRDAARTLSDVRDVTKVLESFDELETRFEDDLQRGALSPIRQRLQDRRADISGKHIDDLLGGMRTVFRDGLKRAGDWKLDPSDDDAFAPSLAKTYARARKAMRTARKSRDPADFHEWRKRVKYHRYHLRLLKRTWPDVMDAFVAEADALSDDLGEHHDLTVLVGEAEAVLGKDDADTLRLFRGIASARQDTLEALSFRRGKLLLAEKPEVTAGRLTGWWQGWH